MIRRCEPFPIWSLASRGVECQMANSETPKRSWSLTVATAHHRRSLRAPVAWIEYVGGPLDGLRTPIEAAALKGKYVGWCHVRHDGPMQAIYSPAEPGRLLFVECAGGPR
jgi:hypothetical protein